MFVAHIVWDVKHFLCMKQAFKNIILFGSSDKQINK